MLIVLAIVCIFLIIAFFIYQFLSYAADTDQLLEQYRGNLVPVGRKRKTLSDEEIAKIPLKLHMIGFVKNPDYKEGDAENTNWLPRIVYSEDYKAGAQIN